MSPQVSNTALRAGGYFAVRLTCGSGPNDGGGILWCVAASYADATLMTDGSLPGAAHNIRLIGIGFGSFDWTVPVTVLVSRLVGAQHPLRLEDASECTRQAPRSRDRRAAR